LRSIGRKVLLCSGVLLIALACAAQEQPAPQTSPTPPPSAVQPPQPQPLKQQPAATPAAPAREAWDTSDGAFSLRLSYWPVTAHPKMRGGTIAPTDVASPNLDFAGGAKGAPGVEIGLPIGRNHTLRLSYFRTQALGSEFASQDTSIFGTAYTKGDYLVSQYRLQGGKVSLDWTTWPFPVNNAHFRLKTLWEVQTVWMRWRINAPNKPTQDADGNYINTEATGTNWFVLPTFGLGAEYMVSRHFRVELRGSGFAIPHRSTLWDSEATAAYKLGKVEIVAGAKAFHFKTTPKREEYIGATLSGGFVGLRWYPGGK
jgi:hypothetical protein